MSKIIPMADLETKVMKTKKHPVRSFFGTFFNFKRWLAYEQIKENGKAVGHSAKSLFATKKSKHIETFDEAVQRLNLTEEDLVNRTQQFLKLARLYLFFAIALVIYVFYLLFTGHILAVFTGLALVMLVSSYSLREHFWYMQMKKRKLGCNLRDWARFVFSTDTSEKK